MAAKNKYKKKIISQMENLGIYSEEYDILIDTLAKVLSERDENLKEWKASGNSMVVEYTNKAGATNITKSPYYLNNIQYNDQILKYCKELCLSPTGLNKMGKAPNGTQEDELDEFLGIS